METQFHVHSGSRTTNQDGFCVTPALDAGQKARPWQFVSEFQQLMGESSEPDPLFFVESWTLGTQEAIENLQRRRHAQATRTQESRTHGFDHLGPLSFVPNNSDADFLSIGGAFAAARSYGIDQPKKGNEESALRVESLDPQEQEWQALAEEYDRIGEHSEPMTEGSAYRLLGVNATSSASEIKAAYRRKVSQWHPDHLQRRTEKERKLATRQMTAINEAYHLLRSELLQKTA